MTKFVVDANVAIKWVLPEIYSEVAAHLLNDEYLLLVPDFFFPEIGNILWKQVRFMALTPEEAQLNLEQIALVPFQVWESKPLMSLALSIAVQVQAVYDCLYLALAITNQCQMVTADERFLNALQGNALAANLCWVEDLT